MTEKPKGTSPQISEVSSNRSDAAASQYQSEEESHEKSKVNSSAAVESDSQETICRKILHTITHSFEKNQREKMVRLFLFIVNFGSHVITFNRAGNVLIRNHILHPRSNILDLLRASISIISPKPIGYKDFQQALVQINVPKHFLKTDDVKKKESPASVIDSQHSGQSKILKWQSY